MAIGTEHHVGDREPLRRRREIVLAQERTKRVAIGVDGVGTAVVTHDR